MRCQISTMLLNKGSYELERNVPTGNDSIVNIIVNSLITISTVYYLDRSTRFTILSLVFET